jgi:hypothetical protein
MPVLKHLCCGKYDKRNNKRVKWEKGRRDDQQGGGGGFLN